MITAAIFESIPAFNYCTNIRDNVCGNNNTFGNTTKTETNIFFNISSFIRFRKLEC